MSGEEGTGDGSQNGRSSDGDLSNTDETGVDENHDENRHRDTHEEIANLVEDTDAQIDAIEENVDTLDEDVLTLIDQTQQLLGVISNQHRRIKELETERQNAEDEIANLQGQLSDATSRLKRVQADFQNYKKRQEKQAEQLRARATEDLVSRIVGVRDNLKRAINEQSEDIAGLRDGVEITLREFDRVLGDENVEEIAPEPGTDVDPNRHEVMVQVDSDQPVGTIAEVYTPGYQMGEKIIQPAQVTISAGETQDGE